MAQIVSGYSLYSALKAEGFELPKNCGDVELEMPVDGVMRLKYSVMLDDEDMQKLGRAFIRMAKDQK